MICQYSKVLYNKRKKIPEQLFIRPILPRRDKSKQLSLVSMTKVLIPLFITIQMGNDSSPNFDELMKYDSVHLLCDFSRI